MYTAFNINRCIRVKLHLQLEKKIYWISVGNNMQITPTFRLNLENIDQSSSKTIF